MSLVALDWLMEKAQSAGLRFIAEDRDYYNKHGNVDDKLYDPRAGLGVFYRWKPRDIVLICRDNGVPPIIHLSVLERVAHGTEDYSPGNLPPNGKVVITSTRDPEKDAAALERASAAEMVLKSAHAGGQSLLDQVRNMIAVGRFSYYIYLLSCIATLIVAAGAPDAPSGLHPWMIVKNIVVLLGNLASSPLSTLSSMSGNFLANPTCLVWILSGFLLAYLLMKFSDGCMNATFSRFWFGHQQNLRDALKRAREKAKQRDLPAT